MIKDWDAQAGSMNAVSAREAGSKAEANKAQLEALQATITKLQERVEELERQMYDITGIIQNITVRR